MASKLLGQLDRPALNIILLMLINAANTVGLIAAVLKNQFLTLIINLMGNLVVKMDTQQE